MPVKLPSLNGGGGSGSFKELVNFPLSIQTTQPTAIKEGHIWVNSDKDAQLTRVEIVESLNYSIPNGTLIFVVGEMYYRGFELTQLLKTTNGSNKSLILSDSNISSGWNIGVYDNGTSSTTSLMFNNPIVYTKVGGILDIETAYMWDGTKWVTLSQNGSYAIITSSNPNGFKAYNRNGASLILSTQFDHKDTWGRPKSDASGSIIIVGYQDVYARVGDVFEHRATIPRSTTYYGNSMSISSSCLSPDGKIVAMYGRSSSGSTSDYLVNVYELNGTTLNLIRSIGGSGYLYTSTDTSVTASQNANAIGLLCRDISNSSNSYVVALFWDSTTSTYSKTNEFFIQGGKYYRAYFQFTSENEILYQGPSIWCMLELNPITKTITRRNLALNYYTELPQCFNDYMFAVTSGSIVVYKISTGTQITTATTQIGFTPESFSLSKDGKWLIVINTTQYKIYEVTYTSTTSITLTLRDGSTNIKGSYVHLIP